jgi:PadR family transcriptional regulator AphA
MDGAKPRPAAMFSRTGTSGISESLAVSTCHATGSGGDPFPERLPELQLSGRFLTDFYLLVGEWARWASTIVEAWPDDPRQAEHDPEVIAEATRRAAGGARPAGG